MAFYDMNDSRANAYVAHCGDTLSLYTDTEVIGNLVTRSPTIFLNTHEGLHWLLTLVNKFIG